MYVDNRLKTVKKSIEYLKKIAIISSRDQTTKPEKCTESCKPIVCMWYVHRRINQKRQQHQKKKYFKQMQDL